MNSTDYGVLGEAKVLSYFIEEGYEVYTPFGGKTENDLVVIKNNVVSRVQIKTTRQRRPLGTYIVKISRSRSNKTKTIIYKFDPNTTDILAVYVVPEDRIVLIDAKIITNNTEISVK